MQTLSAQLHFTHANRQKAVPVPGLVCHKKWDRAAAERADDEGRLALVRETINEMLRALGEPEVPDIS